MNRKPSRDRFARVGGNVSITSGDVTVTGGSVDSTPAAPVIDTGNLLLTDSYTAPIVVNFRAGHLYAVSISDEMALLSVTDAAGLKYLDQAPIGPRDPLPIPFGGQTFVGGLKWKCEPTNTIRAQMVGEPA